MSEVSIVIRAKNEASASFQKAKGDIKKYSDEGVEATNSLKYAQETLNYAMRGDFVGAAQQAAAAARGLWKVILGNPLLALAAGLAAAVVGLVKLWKAHKEAEKAAIEHGKAILEMRRNLGELIDGTVADKVKEQAQKMADGMDKLGLRERIIDIKNYIKEMRRLAEMKLGEMQSLRDEDDIKRAKEEYAVLENAIKGAVAAQKEYQSALDGVIAKEEERAAKAEEAAEKAAAAAEKEARERTAATSKWLLDNRQAFAEYERDLDRQAEEAEKANRAQIEADRKAWEEKKKHVHAYLAEVAKASKKAAEDARAAADAAFMQATDKMADRKAKEKEDQAKAREEDRRARRLEELMRRWDRGARGKHIDDALGAAVAANIADVKEFNAAADQAKADKVQTYLKQSPGDIWTVKDEKLANALIGGAEG